VRFSPFSPSFFDGLVISDDGGLDEFVESFSSRAILSVSSLTSSFNASISFRCSSMTFNRSAAIFSQIASQV
jgi:hypothetical protein